MPQIRHSIEFIVVKFLLCIARALPLDTASAFFGFLAKSIGPHVKASNVARRNLKDCLPELNHAEIESIIKRMWENIGRLAGEMPHWNNVSSTELWKRVQLKSKPPLAQGHGVLLLSGHYGNWELYPHVLRALNQPNYMVYRPANNKYVDHLINQTRSPSTTTLIPKGASGMRQILSVLHNNGLIGMLIDQKVSDGVPMPFFERPAKTITAPGALACKLGSQVVISRVRRTHGAHYEVEVVAIPVTAEDTPSTVMHALNKQLEIWIREYPEQWFWLHKRW